MLPNGGKGMEGKGMKSSRIPLPNIPLPIEKQRRAGGRLCFEHLDFEF